MNRRILKALKTGFSISGFIWTTLIMLSSFMIRSVDFSNVDSTDPEILDQTYQALSANMRMLTLMIVLIPAAVSLILSSFEERK